MRSTMTSNFNVPNSSVIATGGVMILALLVVCHQSDSVNAFMVASPSSRGQQNSLCRPSSFGSSRADIGFITRIDFAAASFYNDFEDYEDEEDDEEEDDDDDMIDPDSLGDWRDFRRQLAKTTSSSLPVLDSEETVPKGSSAVRSSFVCKENEEVLYSQNENLAEEYKTGVWAHEITTVSVETTCNIITGCTVLYCCADVQWNYCRLPESTSRSCHCLLLCCRFL